MQDPGPLVPARTPFRSALILAALFAAIAFLIHFLSSLWGGHLGYGFFRDELYFLVCGHRLAWGYVDQPPLVAFQARIAEALFGLSPTGVRVLSFAASGVFVALTGILTWQLGGRRRAQVLAMSAVLAAPVFLATANYLSMNSFEPCFWMASMLVLLRIADGSSRPRAWLLFGLLAGLGIQNKHSTVFFLLALLIGLLLSPQRRILCSRECAAGAGLAVLIAIPNLIWQWIHQFPTYELLSNIAHSDKNVRLPPLAFLISKPICSFHSPRPCGLAASSGSPLHANRGPGVLPRSPTSVPRRAHGHARQGLLLGANLSAPLRRRSHSPRPPPPPSVAHYWLHRPASAIALLHYRSNHSHAAAPSEIPRLRFTLSWRRCAAREHHRPIAPISF